MLTEDKVVEHADPKNFPRVDQSFGDSQIIRTRVRVPTRVVVGENDCDRVVLDSVTEHLSWMDKSFVHETDAHDPDSNDPMSPIEGHNQEVLLPLVVKFAEGFEGVRRTPD